MIDEDNNPLKADIICENDIEEPICNLYFVVSLNQLSFASYKLIPQKIDPDPEITVQSVFKGFDLKFSKLVSFIVDNDFNKFEYKFCKPRDKESYSDGKKFKLEINEFIQTRQDEVDGDNIKDEDKEIHVCLKERFSLDYTMFLSLNCRKKNVKCSNKFNFAPNLEKNFEIVNASIYIGHEVFELKVIFSFIYTKNIIK